MSDFVKLENTRIRSGVYMGDKVKLGFPLIKGEQFLTIRIGTDIGKRLGLSAKNRVDIYIDSLNPCIWLLKKAEEHSGWMLNKMGGSLLTLQKKWSLPVPEGMSDNSYRFMNHDIFDGGLRLFLPGHNPEDRLL